MNIFFIEFTICVSITREGITLVARNTFIDESLYDNRHVLLLLSSFSVATKQPEKKPDPSADSSAFDVAEQIDGAPLLAEVWPAHGFAGPFDGFEESFERLREQQQRGEPGLPPTSREDAQQALPDPRDPDETGEDPDPVRGETGSIRREGVDAGQATEICRFPVQAQCVEREETEPREGTRFGEGGGEQGTSHVSVENSAQDQSGRLEFLESVQVHQHF